MHASWCCLGGCFRGIKTGLLPRGFSEGCVLQRCTCGCLCSPLTASRGGGAHGGGRPLAAAGGCQLLRRFFFLPKTRNVILAGPRPGQASPRSVRQRTLDMASSTRIGEAQEGGRKRKNAAATGRFRGQGPYRMFYSPPPRQERAVRGEHRHPQVHRCSTQPSEKNLTKRFFSFKPPRHNPTGALRAQERQHHADRSGNRRNPGRRE